MNETINQIGPEKAMETVARWFSGQGKLKIHWTKTTDVCADIKSKTLFIPIACCSSNLSQEALLLLRAKIYHESAHILETEDTNIRGAKFKIFNGLEDVRIEHKTSFKGEGIAFAYRFQNEKFNTEWAAKITAGGISPFMEALGYMMFVADNIVPAWTLTPKAKELVDLADPEFVKVHNAKSTKDCKKLADKIYNLWKDKLEQEQNGNEETNDDQDDEEKSDKSESKSGGGDGDSESEESEEENKDDDLKDGEEDKEDKGKSKKKSSSSGKPSNEKGEKEKAENEGKNEGCQEKKPAKSGSVSKNDVSVEDRLEEEMKGDIKGDIKDVVKELENAMKDPGFYTADRTIDKHVQEDFSKRDEEYYNRCKNSISSEISALVKSAEQAFYFKKRTKTQRHIKHGDIDFSKLVPIAKGLSREVYMRKVDGEDLNTAVSIVIDQSGSMSGRTENVKRLLVAIGEMLHKIGVPFEIFGTTTFDSENANNAFTRYRGIRYTHFKNFSENWMITHPKIMRLRSDDNNIDGEAVEYAAASLATRKERRKIIFSICDGIPESGQYNDDVFRFQLKSTCQKVRKAGMEVYAIGIDTDAPEGYYGPKNFIEIDSENLLSKETIKVFTETIMNGKFTSGC